MAKLVKLQVIEVNYHNQHITIPRQDVEIIELDDGVSFGVWNGFLVATWGDHNKWYCTRDHKLPDLPVKTFENLLAESPDFTPSEFD